MKNNVLTFSVAMAMALPFVACQDETDELSGPYSAADRSGFKQTTSERYDPYARTEAFAKAGDLGERELHQIKEALNSLDDPSLYTLEIYHDGKLAERSGSAALGDLQTSGVYYSDKFSEVLLSELICPDLFPNIFRAIWTGGVPFSKNYQEQVAVVEKIINGTATNTINLQPVALGEPELESMQKVLADVDPAAYRIEVDQEGKMVQSMGSAALSDLRTSGAYYGDLSGSMELLDYDICPPWRNIIRGIWTGGPFEDGKFNEQVAELENILNQAAAH